MSQPPPHLLGDWNAGLNDNGRSICRSKVINDDKCQRWYLINGNGLEDGMEDGMDYGLEEGMERAMEQN